jgi:hypothetical protein
LGKPHGHPADGQQADHAHHSSQNIGRELAVISPRCPEALALLAGCKLEELPVFLQNWFPDEAYSGNHEKLNGEHPKQSVKKSL